MGIRITCREVTIKELILDSGSEDSIAQAVEQMIPPRSLGGVQPVFKELDRRRFKAGHGANCDTEWFVGAQGRTVIITEVANDGLVDGYFEDTKLPFNGINPERLERVP